MTFGEFKAWLAGYGHSFAGRGAPDEHEWQEIVKKLDEVVITTPFISTTDNYLKPPFIIT